MKRFRVGGDIAENMFLIVLGIYEVNIQAIINIEEKDYYKYIL